MDNLDKNIESEEFFYFDADIETEFDNTIDNELDFLYLNCKFYYDFYGGYSTADDEDYHMIKSIYKNIYNYTTINKIYKNIDEINNINYLSNNNNFSNYKEYNLLNLTDFEYLKNIILLNRLKKIIKK